MWLEWSQESLPISDTSVAYIINFLNMYVLKIKVVSSYIQALPLAYCCVDLGALRSRVIRPGHQHSTLKFIYSEKATKFCEISTVDLSYVCSNDQIYGGNFAKFCGLLRIYELNKQSLYLETTLMLRTY